MTASPRSTELGVRIGRRLAELREGQGMSRKGLAARAGVRDTTLMELERGEANPTLKRLEELLALYGTTLEEVARALPPEDDEVRAAVARNVEAAAAFSAGRVRRGRSRPAPAANGTAAVVDALDPHLSAGAGLESAVERATARRAVLRAPAP